MRHGAPLFRSLAGAFVIVAIATQAGLAGGGDTDTVVPPSVRDSMGPIDVQGVTIENFGVVDGRIYRGAKPGDDDEYAQLRALGVTTVVDLREDAKPRARAYAEAAGLRYVHIGIEGRGTPTDEQAAAFLAAVADSDGPIFVHCAGGRHRTGSMVAVYRMVHNGWSVERAYGEMLAYDFYTRNGHGGFKDFVFAYSRRVAAGD
jgi:protein tyrosine phosphatase (PTP) superfamily phosphohydrolase (DUF442 family)